MYAFSQVSLNTSNQKPIFLTMRCIHFARTENCTLPTTVLTYCYAIMLVSCNHIDIKVKYNRPVMNY